MIVYIQIEIVHVKIWSTIAKIVKSEVLNNLVVILINIIALQSICIQLNHWVVFNQLQLQGHIWYKVQF